MIIRSLAIILVMLLLAFCTPHPRVYNDFEKDYKASPPSGCTPKVDC